MHPDLQAILPWCDLPYAEQLEKKRRYVANALANRGLEARVEEVVPSPRVFGARARVKLRSGPGQRLGFHRPGSHDFLEVPLEDVAINPVVDLASAVSERGFLKEEAEFRSDGQRTVLVLPHPVPRAFRDLPAVAWDN